VTSFITFMQSYFVTTQDKFQNRGERGATAVEYGLLVGLIAVAIIATVGLLGGELNGLFDQVVDALPDAAA
jgi:pilus assembly protein Flp/PilA